MGRRIPVLLLLVIIASAIISCGGQTTPQNQSTDQPAVQLSPEESRAKETVTDFLDMCKGGQIQEAIDKYVEKASDFRTTFAKVTFTKILDFSFRGIIMETAFSPPVILLDLNVEVPDSAGIGGVGESPIQFSCTEDGLSILNVNYSPEILQQDTPEKNQARMVASDFLDLCKRGQAQEAIDKFVIEGPEFPSQSDIKLYQNVLDYDILDIILDNSVSPPLLSVKANISTSTVGEIEVQFFFTLDGSRISGQAVSWGEHSPL